MFYIVLPGDSRVIKSLGTMIFIKHLLPLGKIVHVDIRKHFPVSNWLWSLNIISKSDLDFKGDIYTMSPELPRALALKCTLLSHLSTA